MDTQAQYKPFDLGAAKAGAPLITRDGRKARLICWDADNKEYPLVVLSEYQDGEYPMVYTEAGLTHSDGCQSDNDLFMAPIKREGWINVYPYGHGSWYATKEEADEAAASTRIACVRFEYEA